MINFNDPSEFAKALREIDASNEPEAIRRMINQERDADVMHSAAGKQYQVEQGELKQLGH